MSHLDEIAAFLRSLAGPGALIIDTHISRVVIGRERTYKIKKPVRLPYLDFSTREKREAAVFNEIELNRRTAPRLYLGARRISRERDGAFAVDGDGETVETVVEMRSFDQADLFDSMAQRGALTPALMTRLTERIAAFHRAAEPSTSFGGAQGMAYILGVDEGALLASGLATRERVDAFDRALREKLETLGPLLDARCAAGKVRRCHGDLTLRNICLFEGEPTPFDCIEFDDALSVIDVLYDLAFLLMDLLHRGLEGLANLVFNRYLDECDEIDGLPALPFFMAVRASIRAHVTASQARGESDPRKAAQAREEAQAYFDLAERTLLPRAPILVAIGGLSGSGKSTLAAAIAPTLGARILSSDRIRKRMHGAHPLQKLSQEAYRPEISERVYAEMREEAARALAQGCAVVADATFDRRPLAAAIEKVARDAAVPFAGLWLAGNRDTLAARVAGRHGDTSDATVDVLDAQIQRADPTPSWRRLDATKPLPALASEAIGTFGLRI